ncbi:ribonuclease HII [Candidatus Falkowbacteria bacterium]|nr:ribonuclease HII [Candidatus Falkowbacteria bacterium]
MDYSYEQNLMNRGFQFVCGIDEAGRGPLAGPLVAGAVILDEKKNDFFSLINDSKLLNKNRRQAAFDLILKNAKCWAVGVVTNFEIDKHGLAFANKIAMKRAWKHLALKPNYILSDYMAKVYFETSFELIVDGDKKILSVASASIVAKVIRDRMMDAFARVYPQYGFERHKGYGTKEHLSKIRECGLCPIHRRTFEPIKAKLF